MAIEGFEQRFKHLVGTRTFHHHLEAFSIVKGEKVYCVTNYPDIICRCGTYFLTWSPETTTPNPPNVDNIA